MILEYEYFLLCLSLALHRTAAVVSLTHASAISHSVNKRSNSVLSVSVKHNWSHSNSSRIVVNRMRLQVTATQAGTLTIRIARQYVELAKRHYMLGNLAIVANLMLMVMGLLASGIKLLGGCCRRNVEGNYNSHPNLLLSVRSYGQCSD